MEGERKDGRTRWKDQVFFYELSEHQICGDPKSSKQILCVLPRCCSLVFSGAAGGYLEVDDILKGQGLTQPSEFSIEQFNLALHKARVDNSNLEILAVLRSVILTIGWENAMWDINTL